MYRASKIIFSELSNAPVFEDVVEKRIFPIVAGEGVSYPFAVYSLSEEAVTKDGGGYNVWLHVYFQPNKVSEALQFAEDAKEYLEKDFVYTGSGVDFIEKDQSIVVMFNLKMWL